MDIDPDTKPEVHPVAASAWLATVLAVDLSSNNPVYRLLLLLAVTNVMLACARDSRLTGIRRACLFAIGLATLVSGLFGHTGSHVLAQIPPSIPLLGGRITAESLLFGVDSGLAIAVAAVAMRAFLSITSTYRLVDVMPRALQRTGFTIAAAASLLPSMVQNANAVSEAQRMRGWKPRSIRSLPLVAVPILLSTIEDSAHLAEAMEVRGYGDGKRTLYRINQWNYVSRLLIAGSAIALVTLVVAQLQHNALNWYPFPTATMPAVGIWMPLSVAALAIPLSIWPPSSK